MTTTIGKLNVKVSASSAGVKETLDATADSTAKFRRKVDESNTALNQSAGSSSKAGRAFLELSRGVEDAAAVYGTMGLAGALRASSNNISQFASILSPAAGAVAGLAVSLGSVLIPKLFDTTSAAKGMQQAIESAGKAAMAVRNQMDSRSAQRTETQGLRGLDSPDAAKRRIRDEEQNAEELRAKLDDIAVARKQLERLFSQTEAFRVNIGGKEITHYAKLTDEQKAKNKAIQDELNKLTDKQRSLQEELSVSQKITKEIESRRKLLEEQARIDKENADRDRDMRERAAMEDEAYMKRIKDARALSGIAEDIRKTLDPQAGQIEDIAKRFKDRQDAILGNKDWPADLRSKWLADNKAAMAAEVGRALQSNAGSSDAPSALLRGSPGALNAGIKAGLAQQKQNEIAMNTKKTVEQIDAAAKKIVDAIDTAPLFKVGSF